MNNFAIQYIQGSEAESPAKLKKMTVRLSKHAQVDKLQVTYIYVIASKVPLTNEDLARGKTLLGINERESELPSQGIFVGPRFGTISPWCSKATNIFVNCNINIERIERIKAYTIQLKNQGRLQALMPMLYDRMTESVFTNLSDSAQSFQQEEPCSFNEVDILNGGRALLDEANLTLGLALNDQEVAYLYDAYQALGKNPSDIELMMFAQANSEHCRHKVFNAQFIIDGEQKEKSLFQMIKNTHKSNPRGVISAYSDNASVIEGQKSNHLTINPADRSYGFTEDQVHAVLKVETHNHPTAISPFSGASTGSGGEIRDEGATGLGAQPKAGMVGFITSHLHAFEEEESWEFNSPKPPTRIATPLEIMLDAPIGAASFNNEFGRPAINGFFRTYEDNKTSGRWGYLKPIMIAGGVGNITARDSLKKQGTAGCKIYVIGGPGMLIGLGGGAASSLESGSSEEELDFASVQRGNPEMQRRAQEVINRCTALAQKNPIVSIHDVGAGGLSNAVPEIVDQSNMGAKIFLRAIPVDEPGMSPLQIWCNESQERYVILIDPKDQDLLEEQCKDERCPYACIGELTEETELKLYDALYSNYPIDIPMSLLLGNTPQMQRQISSEDIKEETNRHQKVELDDAIKSVLRFPAVSSKSFLITIGDRTVGGLVARDQFVGPWQVPVSNVGVTLRGFQADDGEAIATGEKVSLTNLNPRAAARMTVAETLLNLMAADIGSLDSVKLSANWMASISKKVEDYKLYEMVHEIGEVLCPKLGISIPVGKDSLSMNTKWTDDQSTQEVHSPVSLVLTGLANVENVKHTLVPQIRNTSNQGCLVFIDLSQGNQRLGGSCFAQAFDYYYADCPDLNDHDLLKKFFVTLKAIKENGWIDAYHDRSDGGLIVTLLEMAFAGRSGLDVFVPSDQDLLDFLFNEELGVVIEIGQSKADEVIKFFGKQGIEASVIAKPKQSFEVDVLHGDELKTSLSLLELLKEWMNLSHHIQLLRDNPGCALQELEVTLDPDNKGLQSTVSSFNYKPTQHNRSKPKVALVREQGVNSHHEMASALLDAGFQPIDIHMNELLSGKRHLDESVGMVMCGGFSYGDVLGAGGGWAGTILNNENLKTMFEDFLHNEKRFSLGVCNGCQALTKLHSIIPGTTDWPAFKANQSGQFEAREVMVKVNDSSSILFQGMTEMVLPIVVSHGEGRAQLGGSSSPKNVTLQYVDGSFQPTERYPLNPNGSSFGVAGLCNEDGRVNIMMPHPERSYLSSQLSWHPEGWKRESPWILIFNNAREWVST